jgi:putative ABC transport system substrate-binding protein
LLLGGDENDSVVLSALAFEQALADLGWTNGGNVRMDVRAYVGDTNRIRTLARELVGLQPDIVLAVGAPGAVALQRETRTIPIVFVSAVDPVASGIVARLDRPGGNVTGFASEEASLGGKWLELLSEIAPGIKRVAIMFHPATSPASSLFVPSFETAARSLKVVPITVPVRSDAEIETAVSTLGREPEGGLVVIPGVFAFGRRASIISAAARNNVPGVCAISDFVRDGGLLYYGVDRVETMRRRLCRSDSSQRQPGRSPGAVSDKT